MRAGMKVMILCITIVVLLVFFFIRFFDRIDVKELLIDDHGGLTQIHLRSGTTGYLFETEDPLVIKGFEDILADTKYRKKERDRKKNGYLLVGQLYFSDGSKKEFSLADNLILDRVVYVPSDRKMNNRLASYVEQAFSKVPE